MYDHYCLSFVSNSCFYSVSINIIIFIRFNKHRGCSILCNTKNRSYIRISLNYYLITFSYSQSTH